MRRRLLCFFMILVLMFSTPVLAYQNDSYNRDLKVGLRNMSYTTLKLTFNGDYSFNDETFKSGTSTTISLSSGKVMLNGKAYDEITLIPVLPRNLITLENGAKKYNYFGCMIFKVLEDKLLPINIVDMEDYLKGVVAYEMSNSYPLEALKAQAVAARNYALSSIGKHRSNGYDLCDTIDCQVYRGHNANYTNVIRAVDETKGKVMLYNGYLVKAYYSSSNGGYTEDTRNPWGGTIPYLIVQRDEFDNQNWPYGDKKFTTGEIQTKLKEKNILSLDDTFIKLDIPNIQRFQDVRVSSVPIIYKDALGNESTTYVKKEKVRTFLALPSTYYTVTYDAPTDTYLFKGKGYGHGIGMSQIGARNRANAGQKFDEILKFYYKGSVIDSVQEKTVILTQDVDSAIVGGEIKFESVIQGSTQSHLYKYIVEDAGKIIYTRDYSSDSTFIYKTEKAGSFNVYAYVKEANSLYDFDDYKKTAITVFNPPVINSLTVLSKELVVNKGISVSADITPGSTEGYDCAFEVVKAGKVIETKTGEDKNFSFIPKEAGGYIVRAKVKDRLSTMEYDGIKEVAVDVKDVPKSIVMFSITRNLKIGMSGNDVKSLQEALKKLGYLKITNTTTYFGNSTKAAVISFQKANGIGADGVVGPKTASVINSALIRYTSSNSSRGDSGSIKIAFSITRNLSSGMSGSDVKNLQEALKKLGYLNIVNTDTYFGRLTKAAVISFQKANGIGADGVVGPKTASAINSALIRLTPSSGDSGSSIVAFSITRNLSSGMSGSDVNNLQEALKKLGYLNIVNTDTYFGKLTKAAVISFQKANGIGTDGVVGPKTASAINSALKG